MATIDINLPLNMHTISTWYGTVVAATSGYIEISAGALPMTRNLR